MTDYPDFTVIARLKGEYDGDEKAVALDIDGALQALLYGTYEDESIKVLCDEDGNVKMNLYAQGLEELINRFKYGAPTMDYASTTMPILGWNTIYDIAGKGYIYELDIHLDGSLTHYLDEVSVTMDDELVDSQNFNTLNIYNAYVHDPKSLRLTTYDNIDFSYRVVGIHGFTFESSLLIKYKRSTADNPNVQRMLTYTLI